MSKNSTSCWRIFSLQVTALGRNIFLLQRTFFFSFFEVSTLAVAAACIQQLVWYFQQQFPISHFQVLAEKSRQKQQQIPSIQYRAHRMLIIYQPHLNAREVERYDSNVCPSRPLPPNHHIWCFICGLQGVVFLCGQSALCLWMTTLCMDKSNPI